MLVAIHLGVCIFKDIVTLQKNDAFSSVVK